VAIPSINPRDLEVFAPPLGEQRLADYLTGLLERHHIDVERMAVRPERDNVIARLDGRDPSRTLLLECHTDTVAVEGFVGDPFGPVERDGRLYGRGACDTKAQIAAMVTALIERAGAGTPPYNVVLAATVGEEWNYLGIAALIETGVRADWAVVGEPTELTVVRAHKGSVRLRCTTEGLAAHSSNPAAGANAIYRMARVLGVLERHASDLAAGQGHPELGPPTLSVGSIHGGRDVNVVPDECVIEIDRRLIPGESPDPVADGIARVVCDEPSIDFPIRFETVGRDIPMEVAADSAVVRGVCKACEAALGTSCVGVVPYGTDASKLVAVGVPSVVLGAGSVRQAHTVDEYVEIAQVHQVTDVFRRLLSEDTFTL